VAEAVLVATRSTHKLREILEILADRPELTLVNLNGIALPAEAEEDNLEVFSTFAENALAKARYFAGRTGMLTLADDSGLCVDALGGAPGVRSKRFSGRADLEGERLDDANNQLLLKRMADVPPERRTASYVCAAAVVHPHGGEAVFEGACAGAILQAPVGSGGFGYDPLFFLPEQGATFGQLPPERKNLLSHRADAMRQAANYLLRG
jgi:XTP/dITP diphosphohydrolase